MKCQKHDSTRLFGFMHAYASTCTLIDEYVCVLCAYICLQESLWSIRLKINVLQQRKIYQLERNIIFIVLIKNKKINEKN